MRLKKDMDVLRLKKAVRSDKRDMDVLRLKKRAKLRDYDLR